MSKTYKVTDLLDQCETPLQTHIIMAQLSMLRQLDRQRTEAERRIRSRDGFANLTLVLLTLAIFVIWFEVARVIGITLQTAIFGN